MQPIDPNPPRDDSAARGANDYDVAVVGGAFSGSATALLLKRQHPDLRIVMIEKKPAFDRKVGESAIEMSSWFLTRKLGLDRHMALAHLPKYGLRFWFQNDQVKSLSDASELGNTYQTRLPSFHIDRAVLDEHVHGLARSEGVEVRRPAKVTRIDLHEGGRSKLDVELATGTGSAKTVTARWVVDGTGRAAWLARELGHYQPMPEHPTKSVWARFRDLRDFDGPWLEGAGSENMGEAGSKRRINCSRGLSTNHFTGLGWWVWIIPLPGGDTSVGVVWDERLFDLPAGSSLAERFDRFLASFPAGRELVEGATRLEDDLHALNGLSYRVTQLAGDGWATVGDASGFLDPFYSPGLDWASVTVMRTVDLIGQSLRSGAVGTAHAAGMKMKKKLPLPQAIERHNREFTTGFQRWFEALYLDKYYAMGDFDLMEVALRLDVSLYYFGIVTGPYRMGDEGLDVPFSQPVSVPFHRLMSFASRRLASIAKARIAAGTWGRANAGRRVYLPGFALGPKVLNYVPGALLRLARLELEAIPGRMRARSRRRAAPLPSADTPVSALGSQRTK